MKDLHIHTKYSDGEYDEFEILERIKQAGITEFAICDHDTIEGSKRVYNLLKAQNSNLIFHSGIEITSRVFDVFGGVNVHLLVRDFNYNEVGIKKLIDKISYLRAQKVQRMVDFVKKIYNISFKKSEIEQMVKCTYSVGKPHIYKLLCNYGNYDREEYYQKMQKLHSEDLRLNALDVLKVVHQGAGNVTLAHPIEIMQEYNLSYQNIDELVEYLSHYNLDGLETMHSKQTEKDSEIFSEIAKRHNLNQSCGSDFHGEHVKPNVFLGVCKRADTNLQNFSK